MGIPGLYKFLACVTSKTTLHEFRGKRLAVDSSSWLFSSVISIASHYVEAVERSHDVVDPRSVDVSAQEIHMRLQYLMKSVEISQVYLVMDGKRCPLKANKSSKKDIQRQENLKEARALYEQGQHAEANEKYERCIKINYEFTVAVMNKVQEDFCNNPRVHIVWSPYEADAQLAKLCVDGVVDAVIAEVCTRRVYQRVLVMSSKDGMCAHRNFPSHRTRTYSCTWL
jgi:exonuclease 1